MGLFNLLGRLFRPQTQYEKNLAIVTPRLVKAYRSIARERNLAPTRKMSDKKIMEVYLFVTGEFKEAAKKRNEDLPLEVLNYIAFYFFQAYEMLNPDQEEEMMFKIQLDFEIRRYIKDGLREELRQNMKLF